MFPSAPDLRGHTTALILPLADEARRQHEPPSFDPRSHYAETFWLPILGPSTLLLLRRVAERFDTEPDGFTLDLLETSQALGIASKGGRNSPFYRAINRVVSFKMGTTIDDTTIAIRRRMPTLHTGQVKRLPPRLANMHDEVLRQHRVTSEEDQRRAENVAFTLLQLGDSPDLVEEQLISWGIDHTVAKQSVDVAWANKARHDSATAHANY